MADGGIQPTERQVLGTLRYAVNDEAASYLAIMRLFTAGMSGFLSDQSADEVTQRLADEGLTLDRDIVDQRLSYLVEHGNLARSPRETEARSVREYLSNRARYQLTPRGEFVHRHVEELLTHFDGAREVSSEMLPGMLAGIEELTRWCAQGLDDTDPREVAARITTLFAQFEVLVTSTRQFYSYLTQVLTRFDLGRDEFVLFKGALIDYLQRFVDEISRHMPQLADWLAELEPSVARLCARADTGERLVGVDGTRARRATGLEPADWESLRTWFIGSPTRRSDADNVRRLATDAMRALLSNLRRIAAGADRQQSRYGDLVRLAAWFDGSPDDRAHELWTAAFGLYSARHLSFRADSESDPVPSRRSWWRSPAAEVPIGLRTYGGRQTGGRSGARVDYSAAKQTRLAERAEHERRLSEALRELVSNAGPLREMKVSDQARSTFLDVYANALTRLGRPLTPGTTARAEVRVAGAALALEIRAEAGATVHVRSPAGVLTLRDLAIELIDGSTAVGAMTHGMRADA
ncbi:MAG: TIGR02677 family protein [Dermatophilaceae bacterium]